MSTYFLLKLYLSLHIAGLAISAGLTFGNFLAFQKYRKEFPRDKQKAINILNTVSKFPMLIGIGMAISILSGALMVYLAYAAVMHQLWFKIKIGLIVLIIINGLTATRVISWLRQALPAMNKENTGSNRVFSFNKIIYISTGTQLLLFLFIIILAAFQFN